MVAKRSRNCIDDPRQVGVLFVIVGLVGFWLAYIFGVRYALPEQSTEISLIVNVLSYTAVLGVMLFMIGIGFWGLKNQRIFGVKDVPKIRKYTKRYAKTVNLALIICAAAVAALALFSGALPLLMIFFLIAVAAATMVIIATLMTRIEHKIA